MLPKIIKSQQIIVIDLGRGGISHRLYGSVANSAPVKQCAAAECEKGEAASAEYEQLRFPRRSRGHHLSWLCTLLISKGLSVREGCFQTHATRLECLELRLHSVSLDRQ